MSGALRVKSINDLPARYRKALAGPKPAAIPQKKWGYEDQLVQQLLDIGLPEPKRQHYWLKGRRYRADLAYPPNLIIEVEGAAHRIKGRFNDDILKSQHALLAGIWLLRIATSQVRDGTAAKIVRQALGRTHVWPVA